jgi:hypothetical protein
VKDFTVPTCLCSHIQRNHALHGWGVCRIPYCGCEEYEPDKRFGVPNIVAREVLLKQQNVVKGLVMRQADFNKLSEGDKRARQRPGSLQRR